MDDGEGPLPRPPSLVLKSSIGNDDENRQSKWADILVKLNPNDDIIGTNVYEGRYDFDNDSEENSEVTRNRLIA